MVLGGPWPFLVQPLTAQVLEAAVAVLRMLAAVWVRSFCRLGRLCLIIRMVRPFYDVNGCRCRLPS